MTINGKAKKWFILDTGAEMGVINKSVAEELNLPMSGELEGRGGGEQSNSVSLASDLTLEIPGVTSSNQTLAAIAFDGLESKFGRHMEGILGSEFFHRFVVQIDYENKLMHLYDPAPYSYEGGEQPIPIILDSNKPAEIKLIGEVNEIKIRNNRVYKVTVQIKLLSEIDFFEKTRVSGEVIAVQMPDTFSASN